jgi:AcrR family transcriptional regulator
VAERGYARTTTGAIVARAGVSRVTFHRLFSNRQECFLAAFDRALKRCAERVDSTPQAPDCSERLRRVLLSLLRFAELQPGMARLLLVDSAAAGPLVLARREEVLRRLATAIEPGDRRVSAERLDLLDPGRAGRSHPNAGRAPGPGAESLLAAAAALVWSRLHSGQRPLTSLASPLMAMLVLPRQGPIGAAREISGAAPPQLGSPV